MANNIRNTLMQRISTTISESKDINRINKVKGYVGGVGGIFTWGYVIWKHTTLDTKEYINDCKQKNIIVTNDMKLEFASNASRNYIIPGFITGVIWPVFWGYKICRWGINKYIEKNM